jgi:iron complex transport system ATP-binding protein
VNALLSARALAIAGRLEPTDLVVETPKLVCLVGPNGSGKTSLLHALAGLGHAGGEVRVAGEEAKALTPGRRKRLLAYLPASRDIAWPVSGRDLVALGLPEDAADEAIDRALDEAGAVAFAMRRVDRLSTGERSRLLLARALVARPRLLLLDEPAANLDPEWQLRLMKLLRRLVREEGRLVVAAMHDLDLAARYADRLLIMENGRVVADGPPDVLMDGPDVPWVFGIERQDGAWALVSPKEGRRSSP